MSSYTYLPPKALLLAPPTTVNRHGTSRRQSMGFVLRQLASSLIPIAVQHEILPKMPTTQLNIVFSQQRVLAGEYLNAKILLDSADPDTVIYSLTAEITGVGRTGWVNIHTDKIFETEKTFIHLQSSLCNGEMPIRVGKHQFPLQMMIPESAPSSYESQYGTIRYQVKITLSANTEQATCTEAFPIVVLSRSSFDQLPQNVLSPIDFKDEVDFTCCTLPFGTVSLKISLPRTAYKLGEVIAAQVVINNRTRKGLKGCALLLIMKTQFEARSRYEHVNEKKLTEHLVESIALGEGCVRARSKETFDKCLLTIPDHHPPTQNYIRNGEASIIAIHYVLKMTALPGIECEVPIIVTSKGYMDVTKDAAFAHFSQNRVATQQRTTQNIVEEKLVYC